MNECSPTGSENEDHQTSCLVGTGFLFPGAKTVAV